MIFRDNELGEIKGGEMETKELTISEANNISSREESHFYDNKPKEIQPAKLEKIAVAFANADGGEICIGILDEKDEPDVEKRWSGFSNYEVMNNHLQVLFNITPSLDIKYVVYRCNYKQGYVLLISVDKSSSVHTTSDKTVYLRHGAQSLPVKEPQKIAELSFAKGASSFEDYVINAYPLEQIVESKNMTIFLDSYSPNTDPLEFLINQNLITYREWETRVAATILFHDTPQVVMPRKCAVKIARYETREDDAEREHLKEQYTIEGPVITLIRNTVDKIVEVLSNINILTARGVKKLKYPPEAIWETVVNAIIHRDYSISDDVQILIYNDRIEIMTPGRLPGYVNISNILDSRYARNQKLLERLIDIQILQTKIWAKD